MSNFLTKHSFNSQKMSTFANMKCRLIPDVSCRENQHLAIFSQNLLILNNLGGYCAANKPFNLLRLHSAQVFTFNLFRCHTKVSEGCVVSCGQRSIVSKFHVENVSSNNGFGGRHSAW